MPEDDRSRPTVWVRVAARCADEHGILLVAEAKRAGVAPYQIRSLVNDGLLVREFRGVYRWAGAPSTDLQRIKLAVSATGGVVSHQSAALLWGFKRWDPTDVHVTIPRGMRTPQRPWLFTHESGRPTRGLTLVRDGIEVMKPLPMLLGVAGVLVNDEDLGDLFAHLVSRRLVSSAQVVRFVDRTGSGVAGVRRLRALVAEANGGAAESVAERDLLKVLAGAGIEPPKTQFVIYREGRFVARADVAWPHSRVALEVDGYTYHSDPRSFVADRERGNEIVAAGYRLLRTTPATIRHRPDRLCEEVIEALRQAPKGSVA